MKEHASALIIASLITLAITIFVVLHYRQISGRKGTIVLPAGGTYLGPTSKPDVPKQNSPIPAAVTGGVVKGRLYPYTFNIPSSVSLVTFPDDPYDIYAIFKEGIDPYNAVLIGVDDLKKDTKPLVEYVNGWWKQFSGLKGVQTLTEFTNRKGLKGVKVTFIGGSSDDIFFVSPDHKYIIHLANGPLDKKIFDAIVDTVSWE